MFIIQSYTGEHGKPFGEDQRIIVGEFDTEAALRDFIVANQDAPDFERWAVKGEAEDVVPVGNGQSLIISPPASSYLDQA